MSQKWFEVSTSDMNARFGHRVISVISNSVRCALK